MAFTSNPVHSPCLDEILDRAPLKVSPNTPLARAIAQMQPHGQHWYPLPRWMERVKNGSVWPHPDSYALVVEGEKLVGILTGGDLERLETSGCRPSQVSVAEVMTSPAIALREEDYQDIFTVASLLRGHQIHHLPVIDRRGHPVGAITPQSLRPPDPIALYETVRELQDRVSRLETENQRLSRQNDCLKAQNFPRAPEADLGESQLLLAEIALHIRDSLDLDRILNTTVNEVRQFLGVDRVTIYRFEGTGGALGVAESVSAGCESFLGEVIRDDCLAKNRLEPHQNGQIYAVDDIYTAGMEPGDVRRLERLHVRAQVLVPICLPGEGEAVLGIRESGVGEVDTAGGIGESSPQDNFQLWGLLSVTVADRPRRWKESELDRLRHLAGQVAIAIQQAEILRRFQTELEEKRQTEAEFRHLNAELERRVLARTGQLKATNQELHREIRDRQTLEIRLRSSEARMRGIFAAMTDIVLVLSADAKPLEVVATNPALMYHPKWDILSETLKQFSRPQTAEIFGRAVAEAIETQKIVDFEYQLAQGNANAWFLARISPISEEAAIWVARDITDRKRAEVRLKNAQEELQCLVAERTAALEEANEILIAEIQERRQVETALRQSEELHRAILSTISDAVFITDGDGHFTFICPNANIIFGYREHEVWQLGNIRSLLGGPLFDESRLDRRGEIPNIEREIVDKWGNTHAVLVNVKRVAIGEGTVLYTCRDISDRKQAEEAIKRMNQELETVVEERTAQLRDANDQLLIEILERQQVEIEIEERARQQAIVSELGQLALFGSELDALIEEVATRLARGLNVGYCKIVERQPDGRMLLTLAIAHSEFQAFTFLNREDLGPAPPDCPPPSTPTLHRHDRLNGVSVPLKGQQRDLGCLGVYSDRRKVFVEDDINFIQSVAHVLATAIERKRAEESLQQSEAKFRLFVEHAPAAVAMFDREMRYLAVSRRWSSDYGLGDRDLIGRTHYKVFPEISQRWRDIHERCLHGAIESCDEDLFYRADGTQEWLKWEIRPWHDSGGNIGGIIMFTEAITDRKKAQAEIRIRARQQAIVAQLGQMALSGADLETLIREAVIQVPRGLQMDYCKILEFTSAQHPRLTLSIWSDEENYTFITHEPIPPRAVRRPPPLEPEICRHPNLCGQSVAIQGKTDCFGVLAAYSHDKRDFSRDDLNFLKSVAHILATAIDRQQGDEELQESQQLLRLVMDNIPQSIFWKDRNSVYLGCNRNFARGAGLDHPEQIIGLDDYDLPWSREEADGYRACDARVMESDRPELHIVETQLRAGGKQCWIDTNKIPLHDRAGNVVGILGTYEDITDRKRAEDQLKASLNEKELLLKEIHHRVKNNLLVVSNLLEFQTDYTDDPALIQLLEDSQNRIYSMALIHEKLYRSTGLDRVNFKEYLQALVESLLESYSSQRERVEVELDLQAIDLNIETANPCGLIVNELISNALKHAFPDGRRGKIELQLYRGTGQAIVLAVRDDGVGFPENLDFRHVDSLGLELVCMLTEQLQGEIQLDRDRGTRVEITFVELKYKKRF
ncbi:PAS domain S-box protein [Lyngbya sp. CCY1209]|uniref:PAS domain S-box protein n=1 Tax=Lyngbya sp. CCY1209 TaxID=2886103 RepID=UPI002D214BDB|nr:PAS domain S-box protein [Lyngbya sp. CCY1209]MEB3883118.1 PAS domain S-box protein [Lyngbya sp. CCY1209]